MLGCELSAGRNSGHIQFSYLCMFDVQLIMIFFKITVSIGCHSSNDLSYLVQCTYFTDKKTEWTREEEDCNLDSQFVTHSAISD